MYTVITADIISSRKSNVSFEKLEEKLSTFEYPSDMVTPFKILRGDEVQGLFKGFLQTPQILRRLRYLFYPLQLRIGVGVGEIEKGLDKDSSWQMNGPAFYQARSALDQIKAENDFILSKINSVSDLDLAINTILLLIDTIQKNWTNSQWNAIHVYEELGTYKKAGEELGIAFQNVEKRCNAADWKQVEKAESNIKNIVELWGK